MKLSRMNYKNKKLSWPRKEGKKQKNARKIARSEKLRKLNNEKGKRKNVELFVNKRKLLEKQEE